MEPVAVVPYPSADLPSQKWPSLDSIHLQPGQRLCTHFTMQGASMRGCDCQHLWYSVCSYEGLMPLLHGSLDSCPELAKRKKRRPGRQFHKHLLRKPTLCC